MYSYSRSRRRSTRSASGLPQRLRTPQRRRLQVLPTCEHQIKNKCIRKPNANGADLLDGVEGANVDAAKVAEGDAKMEGATVRRRE